jgi:hypothetical protein
MTMTMQDSGFIKSTATENPSVISESDKLQDEGVKEEVKETTKLDQIKQGEDEICLPVPKEEKLVLSDLIYWRNPFLSATFMTTMWTVWTLVTFFDYSFITLTGRLIQASLVLGAISWVLKTFLKTEILAIHILNMTLASREDLFIEIRDIFVRFFDLFLPLVLIKDPLKSLGFIAALQVLCVLGRYISGLNMLFISMNIVLSVPIVYTTFKTQIDAAFLKLGDKLKEETAKINAKIPQQITSTINNVKAKIQ